MNPSNYNQNQFGEWTREDEMARHVDLADMETARKKQEEHEKESEKNRLDD